MLERQQKAGAFFVHRLREPGPRCPKFTGETSRPLAPQDAAAGVESDTLGRLLGSQHRRAPDIVLREVIVQSPDEPGGVVRLLTNLLEIDARTVALLYRYRWQVELFFRWLKCFANFAHLISESREGVLLSFYVAVIGVLLMYLHNLDEVAIADQVFSQMGFYREKCEGNVRELPPKKRRNILTAKEVMKLPDKDSKKGLFHRKKAMFLI